jgi:hypothetical protein
MKKQKTKSIKSLEQQMDRNLVPAPVPEKKSIVQRFYDDYDDIYRVFHDQTGKLKLSKTQEDQLSRWRFAREWVLLYNPRSDRDIVSAIIYEYKVCESQAYVDVKNMKRFFATLETANKEYEKVMMIEQLKHLIAKLQVDGSVKAMQAEIKARELLSKIYGFTDPENTIPPPVIVNITPVIDATALGFEPIENLPKVLMLYGKKKEERRIKEIQDIDFEELIENPNAREN